MELLTILESPFLFTKRTQAEHLTSGQMLVEWETVKIHLNSIEEHPRDPDNNLHRVCDVAKDILTNMEAREFKLFTSNPILLAGAYLDPNAIEFLSNE